MYSITHYSIMNSIMNTSKRFLFTLRFAVSLFFKAMVFNFFRCEDQVILNFLLSSKRHLWRLRICNQITDVKMQQENNKSLNEQKIRTKIK